MSINKVTITGNLTRDPELRTTASGNPALSLGVAVNDRRKNNQTGQWEDYPNFIDCTMFGTRAEKVSQYLSKGSKVAIEGKLRYSQWERDGQKRSKVEVIIDEIEFMSNQGAPRQQAYQPRQAPRQAPQAYQQPQMPYQQPVAPQQAYQAPQQAYQQPVAAPQPVVDGSMYAEDIPF